MRFTKLLPFALLGAVVLAAVGFWFETTRIKNAPPQTVQNHWDRPVPAPEGGPAQSQSAGQEGLPSAGERSESRVTEPVPYFPPPSIDLTSGKLGNQAVPGTDGIGDVFSITYHYPSQALYMAVVEPDGLRSIWRVATSGKVERVMALSTNPGDIQINQDSKGVMYVQTTNPTEVYRTDDAFASWKTVLTGIPEIFWNVADNGKGTVWGSMHGWNSAVLWRSEDDGMTWAPWVDFQQVFPGDAVPYAAGDDRAKLRHLHDVFYDKQSDALFVGTGDVARYALRSDDNGVTWKKIWDEGFTSHVAVGGGDRFLLGPDQLHSHGIALYDARKRELTPVWDPKAFGYAGYVYSIVNAEGMYYAAIHTEANEVEAVTPRFGIIVSPDALNWYPFLEFGPLGHHARTNLWLATADARVYASVNGRLYAFAPITKQWFDGKARFQK